MATAKVMINERGILIAYRPVTISLTDVVFKNVFPYNIMGIHILIHKTTIKIILLKASGKYFEKTINKSNKI